MLDIQMVFSFVKALWLKIRLGGRLSISFVQQWHKSFKVNVSKGGHLSIGKGMKCRRGCTVLCSGNMEMGNGVFFNQNVSVTCNESIVLGSNVTVANNVVIVDHDHDYKEINGGNFISAPVSIGDGTWIGANCVILRGVTIGKNCVVAAGTVVRPGDYPDDSVIYCRGELCVKPIER